MDGTCGACGRGVHRMLVGKPEGKRSLGIPRLGWEVLQEVGGSCGNWMELAQDRDTVKSVFSRGG
jgi:hypothetical protein